MSWASETTTRTHHRLSELQLALFEAWVSADMCHFLV